MQIFLDFLALLTLCLGALFLWGLWVFSCCTRKTVAILRLSGKAEELEHRVRGCKWLQKWGLFPPTLLLVDCGLSADARHRAECFAKDDPYLHLIAEKDLLTYFDWERTEHGTGI